MTITRTFPVAAARLVRVPSTQPVEDATASATRQNCVDSSRRAARVATGWDVSSPTVERSCALSRGIPSTRPISVGRSTPPDCVRTDRAATSYTTTTTVECPPILPSVWNRFERSLRSWQTSVSSSKLNSVFWVSFCWQSIPQSRFFIAIRIVCISSGPTFIRRRRAASQHWRQVARRCQDPAAVLPARRDQRHRPRASAIFLARRGSNKLQNNKLTSWQYRLRDPKRTTLCLKTHTHTHTHTRLYLPWKAAQKNKQNNENSKQNKTLCYIIFIMKSQVNCK